MGGVEAEKEFAVYLKPFVGCGTHEDSGTGLAYQN